ncbi:uncharacterized protein LOC135232381 [Loxodonta africana]|uniref:uncharacterized protein LOC135232381 n=1 Tax=Loxodonta africana TaxID=9785 RepID=UPI0030D29406
MSFSTTGNGLGGGRRAAAPEGLGDALRRPSATPDLPLGGGRLLKLVCVVRGVLPGFRLVSLHGPRGAGSGSPADVSSVPSLFSILFCLAASSPKPLPPSGSSSLSCLSPDSSSSPRSPWPASGLGSETATVTLLPPFLSDQAQHVHALGTFQLFCQATGPSDVRFVWEKNGQELETCVPVQTHTLSDGRAHVLSWLQDSIRESSEYRCWVLSSAGNRTSKVRVTVMRHEATHQEKWTRELAAWRTMVGEHDRMLQSWRKAWVSCRPQVDVGANGWQPAACIQGQGRTAFPLLPKDCPSFLQLLFLTCREVCFSRAPPQHPQPFNPR